MKRFMTVSALAALAATALAANNHVTRKGTSLTHYKTTTAIEATDVVPAAKGDLRLQQNEQGNSAKQSFDLRLSGLAPSTTYTLAAVSGDDTNAFEAGTFTTTKKGAARVTYSAKGNGHGNPHKPAMPDVLDPLTDLRAISVLSVSETDTQTVAFAWVSNSAKYQYIVKRNLTPVDSGATLAGSIDLVASERHIKFKVLAGGLTNGADYYLSFNSNVVASAAADSHGRVQFSHYPAGAPALLELRSLQVLDSVSNAVLTTTLPK